MYSEWAEDEIRIEELEIYAYHGVHPEETRDGQLFLVNAVLYLDVQPAGTRDDLDKTVNYGTVCRYIHEWMRNHTCRLLEAAAEGLAAELLKEFRLAAGVDLEIRKPHAPIKLPFGCVSVRVSRKWHRAYIGVGSNLGDREGYIKEGVRALREHPMIEVTKVSELINTKAYGGVEQGDFLNGAIEIETILGPWELLQVLHEIEHEAGRERLVHWGPRTLDLDILYYDRKTIDTENLAIPHPDMENREFVLSPLKEIAPWMRHPVTRKTASEMLERLRGLDRGE